MYGPYVKRQYHLAARPDSRRRQVLVRFRLAVVIGHRGADLGPKLMARASKRRKRTRESRSRMAADDSAEWPWSLTGDRNNR